MINVIVLYRDMDVHTRYLGNRDGIFRVKVKGERPLPTSSGRYESTMSAISILLGHLCNNYKLYTDGVNRLCPPDGIVELAGSAVESNESTDDRLLEVCGSNIFPDVCYFANRIS